MNKTTVVICCVLQTGEKADVKSNILLGTQKKKRKCPSKSEVKKMKRNLRWEIRITLWATGSLTHCNAICLLIQLLL
jgi:hypothetical protein